MKYLAICFLSFAASFTARTAPSGGAGVQASIIAPAQTIHVAARRDSATSDRALAGALAAALVALQLRRRQKSLSMARPLA
jgi:hypothetical protein